MNERANEPIRALLVDDEPMARERVRALLANEPDIEIIGECVDGAEAIAAINSEHPDLVFLDIQMPYADGFSVLRSIDSDHMPSVVFVTAYDDFALRAFEVNAVDYLLKPFDEDRFAESLARARRWLGEPNAARQKAMQGLAEEAKAAKAPMTRIAVRGAGQIRFIKVTEIDWIESDGNYVKIHIDGASHIIKKTLSYLEERLDPEKFFRVHRSALVSLEKVDRIEKWFQGDYVALLENGAKVPVSRRRYKDFSERISA